MFLLWILVVIGLVLIARLRTRVETLESDVSRQKDEMRGLADSLDRLQRQAVRPVDAAAGREAEAAPPVAREPVVVRPPVVTPPPPLPVAPPREVPPPAPPIPPPEPRPYATAEAPAHPPEPLIPEPEPLDAEPTQSWNLPRIPINWEELVGVRLFSAVAGIALVLAAVFFLGYSIERGWLQPPIRVAIGVIVATALLVVCELKAARKYPLTANALDAAAIAILFATFYAAHTRWDLIGATATFGLLILVTVLAVMLSIRHESRFIAVLGLLGGFATPALLSTGENRPIPLFAYLLLLNAGLAWVAFKKGWPLLTILTLILTALYQWGWVVSYLDSSQLSLAMGIFLVFAVMSFAALVMSRRGLALGESSESTGLLLERTGATASMMPLLFAIYLAAVRQLAVDPALLFGFLIVVDAGLLAIALARREELMHAIGALATLLVFAIWLATSSSSGPWIMATLFAAVFVVFYLAASMLAARLRRPFEGAAAKALYAAPILLFVFPVLARLDETATSPWVLFGTLYVLLALIAWRSLRIPDSILYFISAFFALAAEASWSASHLVTERLGTAVLLYAMFAIFYLGVPIASRRLGKPLEPRWGAGAVVLASLVMLLFLAAGPRAAAGLWGMAFLLALLNAGLFIESAAGRLPALSVVGSAMSWLVLGVWWGNAASTVGLMPSLMVLVGLTLVMFGGHAWAHAEMVRQGVPRDDRRGFPTTASLGLVGHGFLLFVFLYPEWSNPPWPGLGALLVMTLAASTTALFVRRGVIHCAAVIAAAAIVLAWALVAGDAWVMVALVVAETVIAYAVAWLWIARGLKDEAASIGALATVFIGEATLIGISAVASAPPLIPLTAAHVVNLSLALWLSWQRQWQWIGIAAVAPAWLATAVWQGAHGSQAAWSQVATLATSLYAVFVAHPFILGRRARESRDPYFTAIAGSAFYLFAARSAFEQGGLSSFVGIVPVFEGIVMALLLRGLLRIEPRGDRDLARLAIVAGSALAFATVAIPLQLRQQWITIGWALEGAALAWLYRRIPHRGVLYCATALLSVVFVRLALNPAVFIYEPRGMRVFNWYLYAYLVASVAILVAARWLSRTDDRLVVLGNRARATMLLPPAAVILLFLLLNIEIADFYATGPEITFRFGVTIAQDLTYTVGWLIFGLLLLTAGIYAHNRAGRMAAVALIAITMFKAFLYDMASLGGLYRIASLVGLAISLALVAVALQKFVLRAPKEVS